MPRASKLEDGTLRHRLHLHHHQPTGKEHLHQHHVEACNLLLELHHDGEGDDSADPILQIMTGRWVSCGGRKVGDLRKGQVLGTARHAAEEGEVSAPRLSRMTSNSRDGSP